jgi:hypothetical protein
MVTPENLSWRELRGVVLLYKIRRIKICHSIARVQKELRVQETWKLRERYDGYTLLTLLLSFYIAFG